jgi:hypothetical protein
LDNDKQQGSFLSSWDLVGVGYTEFEVVGGVDSVGHKEEGGLPHQKNELLGHSFS